MTETKQNTPAPSEDEVEEQDSETVQTVRASIIIFLQNPMEDLDQ